MEEQIYRKATQSDISVLARHHAKMFEEMFRNNGKSLCEKELVDLRQKYRQKLEVQLATGECQAVIAENNKNIIASGAFTISSYVPTPKDINNNVAYIHSVFTETQFRGNGIAYKILHDLRMLCQQANLKRIYLFSSKAGENLYKKLGFEPALEAMRMFL